MPANRVSRETPSRNDAGKSLSVHSEDRPRHGRPVGDRPVRT
jgi:hypothetical protein